MLASRSLVLKSIDGWLCFEQFHDYCHLKHILGQDPLEFLYEVDCFFVFKMKFDIGPKERGWASVPDGGLKRGLLNGILGNGSDDTTTDLDSAENTTSASPPPANGVRRALLIPNLGDGGIGNGIGLFQAAFLSPTSTSPTKASQKSTTLLVFFILVITVSANPPRMTSSIKPSAMSMIQASSSALPIAEPSPLALNSPVQPPPSTFIQTTLTTSVTAWAAADNIPPSPSPAVFSITTIAGTYSVIPGTGCANRSPEGGSIDVMRIIVPIAVVGMVAIHSLEYLFSNKADERISHKYSRHYRPYLQYPPFLP